MEDISKYVKAIKEYITNNYRNNFREPVKRLPYPFLVPGCSYSHQLWDWDSWLTGYALLDIEDKDIESYEKGCVLNFLNAIDEEGRIPILVQDSPSWLFDMDEKYKSNIHKPCLAIHALEICEKYNDVSWIQKEFDKFLKFIAYYDKNQYHKESGLYFWLDELGLGFDNDPTVFYHQYSSTGPIYLNTLMYMELISISKLANKLNKKDIEKEFLLKAEKLKNAIQEECFDNVDGFYYSANISLRPIDEKEWLHQGQRRFWHSLPIKITTWAGMLPLWANIATKEQADRCVKRYLNPEGLYSPFGIRSVAKNEKTYSEISSGNPSCWIGPIWINANYLTYIGLKNYGYDDLAKEIAIKTIKVLGQDVIENKQFHEYYNSNTGEGIRGPGFQSWNFLVLKMINDLKL